jgi:hypothetical protein
MSGGAALTAPVATRLGPAAVDTTQPKSVRANAIDAQSAAAKGADREPN